MFNNLKYVARITGSIKKNPDKAARIILGEVKDACTEPDLLGRLKTFYEQNKE